MFLSSLALFLFTLALAIASASLILLHKHKPTAWAKLIKSARRVAAALQQLAVSRLNGTKAGFSHKQPQASGRGAKSNLSNGQTKSKQVHFADVICVSSTGANGKSNTSARKVANKALKTNQYQVTTSEPKQQQQNLEINNNNDNHLDGEPPSDELDSSVLLEVFQSGKPVAPVQLQHSKKNKQRQAQKTGGQQQQVRKRHSSDSNQGSYSPDHLFKLIAASSLTRDEVELAVETLLNKLESGETDWQKPKGDPILRLKNQLRDSETALATEIQNHEQTRARLGELRAQLQGERSTRTSTGDELARAKKDLLTTSLALERAHNELSTQRTIHDKTLNESSKVLARLEEDNARLQSLLSNSNVHQDELNKLRHEFNENIEQLNRYEAANESLKSRLQDLETTLRGADVRLDQMRQDKQRDDYEACAKISDLESDRVALEKALKDHMVRLNEISEANKLLEESLNESRLACAHKDELMKRLKEERHINESALKRTLYEMEHELRELHERLSSRTASDDEKFRKEITRFEHQLNDAGEREQRLKMKMKQLREGLSELFPELRTKKTEQAQSEDWVHQYLIALRQLTVTVEELRRSENGVIGQENMGSGTNNNHTSPLSKRSAKSTGSTSNGKSSRVGSPASNGRSSRASTNRDHDKKQMEIKLVEDLALFCLRCLD